MDNITDEGKKVINDIAAKSLKVIDGINTTVTAGTEDGTGKVTTYAVNVSGDLNGISSISNQKTIGGTTTGTKITLGDTANTVNVGGAQITNVASGLANANGTKNALKDADGDTLKNVVNVGDLKDAVSTSAAASKTTVSSKNQSIAIKPTTETDGHTNYDLTVSTGTLSSEKDASGNSTGKVSYTNAKDTENKDIADSYATVSNVADAVNNSGWNVEGNGDNKTLVKAGHTVNFVDGNSTKAFVSTKDGVTTVSYGLSDDVTIGKKGENGTIGVNGRDGSAVVINGKDGSIGLNGKGGANGMTIKGADGKGGVDGKDGTTRLVYETKDGDKTVVHEVATMDDGMKYAGDTGNAAIKLNNTTKIVGGAISGLSDNNIGVVASQDGNDAKLTVKLAKDLTGLNNASTENITAANGMTIGSGSGATTVKSYKEDGSNTTALDVGGSRISNVAPGEKDTDAATVGQLNKNNAAIANSINNLGGEIQDVGANAAALAGLVPIQYDLLEPTQIMAAVGSYRSSNAMALGVAHYAREDLMFHAGTSLGTRHNMFNAGVTWKFGPASRMAAVPEQYKAGPISSTYVMQDEVRALKAENDALRKDNEQTKAALDDVLKRLAALEAKK